MIKSIDEIIRSCPAIKNNQIQITLTPSIMKTRGNVKLRYS